MKKDAKHERGIGQNQGVGFVFLLMLTGINTCQTRQRQKVDCKFSNYI